MTLAKIIVGTVLLVLAIAFVHAAHVLSANPYQRVKAHEDLAGRFPPGRTLSEKLHLIDLYGISPAAPGRLWILGALLCLLFAVVAWG